jgi:2-polyprenyl-3-methyl-5-hydroxy-6-metoxy-1,4-benzoquinol methylase
MSSPDDLTRSYYRTTAGRSHSPTREYYELNADGLRRRLGPWLPTDSSMPSLDLACGCGELLYALERAGFRDTTGVDLCAEELEQAQKFTHARLEEADILDFLRRQPDQAYGFITAFNILEHMPKEYLCNVLTESRRVLRPGGTLVAMVPNAMSPFGSLTRHWDFTHEWAFTPNNFRQLAALSGFSDRVDFRECGPIAHGPTSTVRYALWQLLRTAIRAWLLVEIATARGGVYTMDMMVRMHRV